MSKVAWFRYANDDDNVTIISSSWCVNRSGICLSFAVPIQVMSVNEINEFGKAFEKAINASYKDLIKKLFYAKTQTPVVCSSDSGQIIMMWSFQGDNNEDTKQILKRSGIKEIKYE